MAAMHTLFLNLPVHTISSDLLEMSGDEVVFTCNKQELCLPLTFLWSCLSSEYF